MPHSNAEVERLFSKMSLAKTKLPNRLQISMVSAILTVQAGLRRYNQCCNSYKAPDSLLDKIKTIDTYKSNVEEEAVFDILY